MPIVRQDARISLGIGKKATSPPPDLSPTSMWYGMAWQFAVETWDFLNAIPPANFYLAKHATFSTLIIRPTEIRPTNK